MTTLLSAGQGSIYSATYSNVPVYEFKLGSDSVMRRRVDDWINATHILKVAGLDKPSRTRILEREVQKGVHEKIQGGYGKYQGTWVPLESGRLLAERNQILNRLGPIFDFVPGDKSPPPAPKHTNAVSARPRTQKLVAANRRIPTGVVQDEPSSSFMSVNQQPASSAPFGQEQQQHPHQHYGNMQQQSYNDDESMAQVETSSMIADDDANMIPGSQQRKRKRGGMQDPTLSIIEQNHIIYGDQLLDYFMTVGDAPTATRVQPPSPPPHFQVDRAIDDQGNTALHWACAMGDLDIVKDLMNRGADIHCLSSHDETPLVRAVLFTNNYEKGTMQEMAELLKHTITFRDWFGATVFNHLAATTRSKGKWRSSRYYAQVLIDKLNEMFPNHEITILLSSQDSNGDTAALTAAKNGCYKLATTLLAHCPESGDLQNKSGETGNEILMEISRRFQEQATAQQQLQQGDVEDENDFGVEHNSHNNHLHHHLSSDTVVSPSRQHQREQQNRTSEVTAALLQRVGGIMEEANRRLAHAYGEVKSAVPNPPKVTLPADGADAEVDGDSDAGALPGTDENMNIDDDPKGVWAHIEAERETLRRQVDTLSSREGQGEPLDAMVARYNTIRQDYESLIEQIQQVELRNRFKQNESTVTVNGAATSEHAAHDPAEMYDLSRTLLSAQTNRQNLVRELIHQRANTAASARMDVHRKLVALATGLPEDDLDPMAGALADTLEFERASQTQIQNRNKEREREENAERALGVGVDADGLGIGETDAAEPDGNVVVG